MFRVSSEGTPGVQRSSHLYHPHLNLIGLGRRDGFNFKPRKYISWAAGPLNYSILNLRFSAGFVLWSVVLRRRPAQPEEAVPKASSQPTVRQRVRDTSRNTAPLSPPARVQDHTNKNRVGKRATCTSSYVPSMQAVSRVLYRDGYSSMPSIQAREWACAKAWLQQWTRSVMTTCQVRRLELRQRLGGKQRRRRKKRQSWPRWRRSQG